MTVVSLTSRGEFTQQRVDLGKNNNSEDIDICLNNQNVHHSMMGMLTPLFFKEKNTEDQGINENKSLDNTQSGLNWKLLEITSQMLFQYFFHKIYRL